MARRRQRAQRDQQRRIVGRNEAEKKRILGFEKVDVVIALSLAGLVNLSMMIVAAALFHTSGLTGVGTWVAGNSVVGGFVFGTLNRLLIPLGLHHILNNPPWFLLGDFTKADGTGAILGAGAQE